MKATAEVKKADKVKKSEVKDDNMGMFDNTLIRMSPATAEYQKFHTSDGWMTGVGKPRVPEINKDIRMLLMAALRNGCALYATSGGLRVMSDANGIGGVCFIESKNFTSSSPSVFLFNPANRKSCEEAGLVVQREQKGVYIEPRNKEGKLVFDTLMNKFKNNHSPREFVIHDWEGYKVDKSLNNKKVKVKKDKAEVKPSEKKVVKVEVSKPEKVVVMKPKHDKVKKENSEKPEKVMPAKVASA